MRVWKRVSVLLMSAQAIAQALGVSLDTISHIRRRWLQAGVAGLVDQPRPGRPPQANARYLRLLQQTVQTNPRRPRLLELVGLAAYMKKRTGIGL